MCLWKCGNFAGFADLIVFFVIYLHNSLFTPIKNYLIVLFEYYYSNKSEIEQL